MEMLGCKGLMCYTGLILQGEAMWINISIWAAAHLPLP